MKKMKRTSAIPAGATSLEGGAEGKGELPKKPCWGAEDLGHGRWRWSGVRGWEGDDLQGPFKHKPFCGCVIEGTPKQSQAGTHSTWGCDIFPAVVQGIK